MPYINALNDFINMNINNDNSRNNDKNKNNASPSSQVNALETFVVGGVAGIASKTVSAPLERVKLLIQNQEEMIKQGTLKEPYKGIMDCFSKLLRQEGVYYLWRGNLANCVRYVPTTGFNFTFKDIFTNFFSYWTPSNAGHTTRFVTSLLSGACAGSCCMVLVYPLDYARTRMANDAVESKGSKRHYKGLVDVWMKTFQSDGIVGIYRGLGISVVGIFVYRGFFFGLYDFFKPMVITDRKEGSAGVSALKLFALGYATTVTAEVLSYPLDTIRRRMMMTSENAVKYDGSWHCAKSILTQEGWGAMFKGCGANILRGVAGAVVLSFYDLMLEDYVKNRNRWLAGGAKATSPGKGGGDEGGGDEEGGGGGEGERGKEDGGGSGKG